MSYILNMTNKKMEEKMTRLTITTPTLEERKATLNLEVLNDQGKPFYNIPLKDIDYYTENVEQTHYTIHYLYNDQKVKVQKNRIKDIDTFQKTIVGWC